jgi:hypothetical protein
MTFWFSNTVLKYLRGFCYFLFFVFLPCWLVVFFSIFKWRKTDKNITMAYGVWVDHMEYGFIHLQFVKGCKFRPMLGAQGLWAGRDLYRATPAVTRSLGFSGLIWRTAPFSRLLWHTRGCGGSILTRIVTGPQSIRNSSYQIKNSSYQIKNIKLRPSQYQYWMFIL